MQSHFRIDPELYLKFGHNAYENNAMFILLLLLLENVYQ